MRTASRFLASVGFLGFGIAFAQQPTCSISVTAQLVDKDLNLKPIPKFKLELRHDNAAAQALVTGFDGKVSAPTACGTFHLASVAPITFGGHSYTWDVPVTLEPNVDFKIDLSIDNALVGLPEHPIRQVDELAELYKKYQNSVVTVWGELGRGTGFFIGSDGLIVTNQHVIGPSEFISVQFDQARKVRAVLLASDAPKDIAVLWVNPHAFPDAVPAPLAVPSAASPLAVEGERVFTIGSPLNQRKILTTGVVSKVEERAIISDININHGNSGGPLFNSLGEVIGVTTFLDTTRQGGPGVSGIVRVEQVIDVVTAAKDKRSSTTVPSTDLLPVEPTVTFPIDALKEAASRKKFKIYPYVFSEGDYNVAIITPILKYRLEYHGEAAAAASKRRKSSRSAAVAWEPLDDLHNWAEYAGEYEAVIQVRAAPKLKESFGSAFARGLAANYGGMLAPAKLHYKADFYRMVLSCGGKEITPIQPSKVVAMLDVHNGLVNITDAAYEGFYTYPADAISPSCGEVTLDIYSEKNVLKAKVRKMSSETLEQVWNDFAAYRGATSQN